MTPLGHSLGDKRFWRVFTSTALGAIGASAAGVGIIDPFFPGTLPDVAGPTLATIALAAAGLGLYRAWPRTIVQPFATPGVTIAVVRGDLFAQPGHLVIGMCDTFDTASGVIAATSVQALFATSVYGSDTERFDADLDAALAGTETSGLVQKAGKIQRYPLGTTAALGGTGRRFFCVAYTSMNERNEARASVDGVWLSLSKLWESVCEHANGGVVYMPVIGGGQSRLDQQLSTADAIRLQALNFWLACRREKVTSGLTIVVQPSKYDRLDIREIQDFLTSLVPA